MRPDVIKATNFKLIYSGIALAALSLVGYTALDHLFPHPVSDSAAIIKHNPVLEAVNNMSLRQQLASLLILHTPGADPAALETFAKTYQPGGLILMGDNIPDNAADLTALTATIQQQATSYPLLLATDEEGCTVKRLPWDTFACAPSLKASAVEQTKQAFRQRSQMLKDAGVNLNFGIVADVTADPQSFIFPRVFGGDPQSVADRVSAAVQGTEDLTLSTLKHFPGHGETPADSHTTIPTIGISKAAWLKTDAVPFAAGVKTGADVVMFGHLIYANVDSQPASLSKRWHDILSQELGFKGIAITDDLIMLQQSKEPQYQNVTANVVAALNAGNQLVLLVTDHNAKNQPETLIDINKLLDGLEAAVRTGSLDSGLVKQDAFRVMAMRATLASTK